MSLQAYQQAAKRAEQPRDSEYRLFGEVTRTLMEVSTAAVEDFRARIDVLDWNRRMWMTLAADCAQPTNPLDPALRAQIISLSLWVGRHSSAIMRGEETFDALIEVNRIMMQGLAARSGA